MSKKILTSILFLFIFQTKVFSQAQNVYCPKIDKDIVKGQKDKSKDKGNVKELQYFLKSLYSLPDDFVSGYYGNDTEKHVLQFKKEHDLDAISKVGKATLAKILEYCPNLKPVSLGDLRKGDLGQISFAHPGGFTLKKIDSNNFRLTSETGDVELIIELFDLRKQLFVNSIPGDEPQFYEPYSKSWWQTGQKFVKESVGLTTKGKFKIYENKYNDGEVLVGSYFVFLDNGIKGVLKKSVHTAVKVKADVIEGGRVNMKGDVFTLVKEIVKSMEIGG